jgi:hypothetical protein
MRDTSLEEKASVPGEIADLAFLVLNISSRFRFEVRANSDCTEVRGTVKPQIGKYRN